MQLDSTEASVRVGISWSKNYENDVPDEDMQAYLGAVKAAGAEPVRLPLIHTKQEAKNALDGVDCLILTGGDDIDPALYHEIAMDTVENVNPERDCSDMLLLADAFTRGMPILGICRGMQLINVYLGGTLYQDMDRLCPSEIGHRPKDLVSFCKHDITVRPSRFADYLGGAGMYRVNSWHHQAVKQLGDGLNLVATAEDGIVEAYEWAGAERFLLGVQFHPEYHVVRNEGYREIFCALVEAGRPRD